MKFIKIILATVFLVCPSIALGLISVYQLFRITYLLITNLQYFIGNMEVVYHYMLLSLGILACAEAFMDKAHKIITEQEEE